MCMLSANDLTEHLQKRAYEPSYSRDDNGDVGSETDDDSRSPHIIRRSDFPSHPQKRDGPESGGSPPPIPAKSLARGPPGPPPTFPLPALPPIPKRDPDHVRADPATLGENKPLTKRPDPSAPRKPPPVGRYSFLHTPNPQLSQPSRRPPVPHRPAPIPPSSSGPPDGKPLGRARSVLSNTKNAIKGSVRRRT